MTGAVTCSSCAVSGCISGCPFSPERGISGFRGFPGGHPHGLRRAVRGSATAGPCGGGNTAAGRMAAGTDADACGASGAWLLPADGPPPGVAGHHPCVAPQPAQGGGDRPAHVPDDRDGQAAQWRHVFRAESLADAAVVLVPAVAVIEDVVYGFNRPVSPDAGQKRLRIGLLPAQRGNADGGSGSGNPVPAVVPHLALDAERLPDSGVVEFLPQVVAHPVGDPDPARLPAAMLHLRCRPVPGLSSPHT